MRLLFFDQIRLPASRLPDQHIRARGTTTIGVARIDPPARRKVIEHAMTVIGAERDFLAILPPPIFLQENIQDGDHIDVPLKVIRLMEAQFVMISSGRPEMSKVNA
jgi:hypothetical protein